MGLVLWYALGFSQKQAAGVTLKEALAKRTPGYIQLGVIAFLAAAVSYYFDASDALVTLFAPLPKALLVPADFLHSQTKAFLFLAVVGEITTGEIYRRKLVDPNTKGNLERHSVITILLFIGSLGAFTYSVFFSPESKGGDAPQNGVFALLAVVMLANQIHDYHKTVLIKQTLQKPIQLLYALVITCVTVSLIALDVLPSTTALILLAVLASCQAVKMLWLLRYIP